MSEKKGKMVTCCRCDNFIFLEYLGKGQADGGYTTWDKYEDLPDTWLEDSRFGHLCPDCAEEFRLWANEFFNGQQAYVWWPTVRKEAHRNDHS